MAISSEAIAAARDADILETARRCGAVLKRISAGEWAGACPACDGVDRFAVNTRKRVFNCRGFGGGDAIAMVEHALGLSFVEATEFLTGERVAPAKPVEPVKTEPDEREKGASDDRRALWLWRQRQPIAGTPAERYLRQARGYKGPIPATLGYLPARDNYPPSMIAAFGLASEPEPGLLAVADAHLRGVHVTRLAPDGAAKAGTDKDKIMIGNSLGYPIVVAPPNDGLGLTISEGIEDALSIAEATGLGAWSAGAGGRMPALADVVPDWIGCVTILGDPDKTGRRGAEGLRSKLEARHIETHLTFLAEAAA